MEIRGEFVEDPNGDLDEVVAHNAIVHLERMANNAWSLIIEEPGEKVNITLHTERILNAFVYERTFYP